MGLDKDTRKFNLFLLFFFILFPIALGIASKAIFLPSFYFILGGFLFLISWILLVIAKWPQLVDNKIKLGIDGNRPVQKKIYVVSYILLAVSFSSFMLGVYDTL